jgi:hypothetical protein
MDAPAAGARVAGLQVAGARVGVASAPLAAGELAAAQPAAARVATTPPAAPGSWVCLARVPRSRGALVEVRRSLYTDRRT